MPKTPNGKKRKSSGKKPKGCKPKRLKFDGKEQKDLEDERPGKATDCADISDSDSDHEPSSSNGDKISERDIDELLEENAARNNLTATNVKSIIHHVLTDKRVLAMVQNAIAESGESSSAATESVNEFEPKMTRSKVKKSGQADPISLLTKSPVKARSKPHKHFTELELPEDSSDEEYNPAEDERPSDDDSESCASFTSDLASPRVPGTPDSTQGDGESPLVTRSLSKKRSQEQAFKMPLPLPAKESSTGESDLIAKRTRSRLPLTDTTLQSIEASFEPPDVIPELYEAIHVDDLDTDDIEWQRWLQSLVLGHEETDDENEDTEYNFMAEDHKEEQEEYRNDRAVRIPQKEVNELITELLRDYKENEDICSFLTEPGFYVDEESPNVPQFSPWQRDELSKQLQMHTQLLTQVFLTSQEEPTLQAEAVLCREFVNELQGFSERASSARLCMALDGSDVPSSAFCFPGLDESVRIVNAKSYPLRSLPALSPRKSAKKSPLKFPKSPAKKKKPEQRRKTIFNVLPELSQSIIQVMGKSPLFKFTTLLPHFGMFPRDAAEDRRGDNPRIKFSQAEDNLLALGIAQFAKDWKLIQAHLLPVKSSKQLQIRCKNLSSTRAKENVVKYFRRTGEMWPFSTKIVSNVPYELTGRRYGRGEPEVQEWLVKYRKQVQEKEKKKAGRMVAVVHPQVHPRTKPQSVIVTKPSSPSQSSSSTNSPVTLDGENVTRSTEMVTGDERKKLTQISPTNPQTPGSSTNESKQNKSPPLQNSKTVQSEEPTASDHEMSELQIQDPISVVVRPSSDAINEDTVDEVPKPELKDTISQTAPTEGGAQPEGDTSTASSPSQEREDVADNKDGAGLSSRACTTGKGKGLRQEKTTGGGVGRSSGRTPSTSFDLGTGSSKKTGTLQPGAAQSYALEPDPKGNERAQAMAEGYLGRVKKTLKNDSNTYEELLRTLVMSSSRHWSPVQIFAKMKEVLNEHPDLVEDFIAFLEPEEAVEAGVFMNNLEFTQARGFLRKLEVHFQKSPSHFQKIIRALSGWNKSDKSPLEFYESMIPLLRGQQHLIEEFSSFFGELNPPPCRDEDFEEVELASGSETEMDDFEEVVIPDYTEPRKGRLNTKLRPNKLRGKKGKLQKPVLRPSLVKGVKQQNASSKSISTKTKSKRLVLTTKEQSLGSPQSTTKTVSQSGDISINNVEREESSPGDDRQANAEGNDSDMNGRNDYMEHYDEGDEQEAVCRIESSPSEGPFSNTNSMHTEWSNDSFKMESCEAKEYQQHDSPGSANVTDYEYDEEETQIYAESDGGEAEVEAGGSGDENTQEEESCDDSSNGTSDDVDDFDDQDNNDDDVGMDASVSAKNLRLGHDGKLVVLWTREDDRMILRSCQEKGASDQTFQGVAKLLGNKSADEVRQRFFELMKLFEVSAKEGSERDLGENGSSSEEDDESGTCDSDPDPDGD